MRQLSQQIMVYWWVLSCGLVASAESFDETIRPLLRTYCLNCHSSEKREGELDLQRFSTATSVKKDAQVWEHVLEQLSSSEMPPKSAKQLPAAHKQRMIDWVRSILNEVALENAGDPGPVVLRRLSNHEYTYSLRDLTGLESLEPAREFPVDGAAGEGFTNVGAALVMSPSLLQKYLDDAKELSRHCVLLPDGIRFSASDSPHDWTNETLARIRAIYSKYSGAGEHADTVAQGISLDTGVSSGRLPLDQYLDALQGRRDALGLSPKYLNILRNAFEDRRPTALLDPLRAKYRAKQLSVADIEPWQKALWRFTTVGHIGKLNGPRAWQEPLTPLVSQQDLRVKLDGDREQLLYLVTSPAGDGNDDDEVVWENPRLISKGKPEIPVDSLPELVQHLESERSRIIQNTVQCLAVLATGQGVADQYQLEAWREYLGFESTSLEPLLVKKMESTPDYNFIKGWVGDDALSVLANSSDAMVRIPGIMKPHSVATHPAPGRAAVIAWRSPSKMTLRVTGDVVHAHPECGNGITWTLEVRRGRSIEVLATGLSQRSNIVSLGAFENVQVDAGHVIALVIGPRDGNHSCDLTTINLTLTDGQTTWDVAKDISPNILLGNPHGPWHFLSQPTATETQLELPRPIAQWRKSPTPELAVQVKEYLEQTFPLNSPLLAHAMKSFRPASKGQPLFASAPSVIEIKIPAGLAQGAEFAVTGRLKSANFGSVQMQVLREKPTLPHELVAGTSQTAQKKGQWSDHHLVTEHSLPIIVNEASPAGQKFLNAFDEFRQLFPLALCYTKIVPVDEVVTLTLYYREDEHYRRLMLDEEQIHQLDRLWEELLFVAEAPLKQVDAFEQLWQYATQDANPAAFEPLREPTMKAAAEFKIRQKHADIEQRQAVIDFAHRAWRRPLTDPEIEKFKSLPPRLMLTRVLAAPAFLYRGETVGRTTGPINDWELATRLSYFLWSSVPDEELRRCAKAGTLRSPDVLAAQARRMLKDERVRRLATEFGCQWLHIRDVATLNEKSERHFPTFVEIREDMQEEATRFFIDLFQNNRGVLTLLDADHTFINDALAQHYGIEIEGNHWRRIDGIRAQGRGGILGLAATLSKHSGASRTSAILRGTWLSEVLLGDRLPNPPKGVPVLPDEAPVGLSERQLIERHSNDPNCADCHRRIDPYGFALEGFDAIGRIRKADTKTRLYDGTPIEGLDQLRAYLVTQRRQDFLKQFSRKLLGFALGRSVQLSDQPLIDAMVQSPGNSFGELVELVVRSPQFRNVRGQDETQSP